MHTPDINSIFFATHTKKMWHRIFFVVLTLFLEKKRCTILLDTVGLFFSLLLNTPLVCFFLQSLARLFVKYLRWHGMVHLPIALFIISLFNRSVPTSMSQLLQRTTIIPPP